MGRVMTLLVVDDEPALRKIVAAGLRRAGYNVLMAGSGKEAIAIIDSQEIDLIVSDMRMANGDGMFLLEHIRKNNPEIPILIFMTGFSDVNADECVRRGAQAVVPKPFNQAKILATIEAALKKHPLAAASGN